VGIIAELKSKKKKKKAKPSLSTDGEKKKGEKREPSSHNAFL